MRRNLAVKIDNEPKLPRFVDLPELSRRLCLQKSAIYELFASGELQRIKLTPKKTVVLEADLDSFIQRKVAEARQVAA
jgi:predicted DNA-binding transcriptional regulator AlpA